MLFVQSLRGLSHTKLEDTKPEHLELAVAGARPARDEDARLGRRVTACYGLEEADCGHSGCDERQPQLPAGRDRVLVEPTQP